MRISELNKREPFNIILQQTLIEVFKFEDPSAKIFYVSRFSWEYIKYFKQIWFCNPYLNFYAKIESKPNLFAVLKKEYSHSRKRFMAVFQWLFVYMSISKIGRVLFSSSHLVILSDTHFLENTIILGGNHRLRLLRPISKTIQVILKEGFKKSWLTNETSFRNNLFIDNIPTLLKFDFPYLSFEEEYKPGIPINRLNIKEHNIFKEQAYEILYKNISLKHVFHSKMEVYSLGIITKIINELGSTCPQNKWENEIGILYNLLEKIKHFNINPLQEISITKSHGDFQDANILIDANNDIVIIDWESCDYRWIGYDYLTLALGSRGNFDTDYTRFEEEIINNNTLLNILKNEKIDLKLVYLLYCLEELHFQVLNHCEPAFYIPGKFLDEYFNKVKYFISQI